MAGVTADAQQLSLTFRDNVPVLPHPAPISSMVLSNGSADILERAISCLNPQPSVCPAIHLSMFSANGFVIHLVTAGPAGNDSC
jgi:hypothetical protein